MISYERDIYSNFVIKSEDLNIETFYDGLLQFIKEREKIHDGRAIKINVNHQHASINPILKEIGFEFFYGDNEFTQWVYKNGSSIP